MTVNGHNGYDVHLYDAESGHYISQEHQRLAEVINDYDSEMSLVWIPPGDRALSDTHPYAIMHHQADGRVVMVMKLTELEMTSPQDVLRRLWTGDQRKNDVLSNLEASEAAAEALRLKQQMDEREEANEVAQSILKSPLHTYRHKGRRFD